MTVKQKQHLLAYLGYYVGDIDGKFGPLSKVACKAFQKDYGFNEKDCDGICGPDTEGAMKDAVANGMPVRKVTINPGPPKVLFSWDKVKNFKREEFACKCGKYCNGFPVEPDPELVEILQKIRHHFGKPVHINSAIRCEKHNTNVGGASGSQHKKGTAADIRVEGISPGEVAAYAETLLPGTGGIGRYATFTHVDVRKVKARWNG